MAKLQASGFNRILIQNTGSGSNASYHGPGQQFGSGPIPYDTAMQRLKQRLQSEPAEIIALIDNDCFIADPKQFQEYLKEFEASQFDFVCHGVSKHYNDRYFTPDTTGDIVQVPDLKFIPDSSPFGFAPEPHFENAYLLMRKSVFDKLKVEDFRNSRQMIRAFTEAGGRIGMHRANYAGSHSHWGPGWFHAGALFGFYHHIEAGNVSAVRADSEFDKARLGYFAAVERDTGVEWGSGFAGSLQRFYEKCGGKDECLSAWNRLVKGTCMEEWPCI